LIDLIIFTEITEVNKLKRLKHGNKGVNFFDGQRKSPCLKNLGLPLANEKRNVKNHFLENRENY
jgi:hypothetical protein